MFKRIIAAVGVGVLLTIGVSAPAMAGGHHPPPGDCVPEHTVHHDAITKVKHHDAETHWSYHYVSDLAIEGETWLDHFEGLIYVDGWITYHYEGKTEVVDHEAWDETIVIKEAWDEVVPQTGNCEPPVEADAKADVGIVPATCDSGQILEYGAGNITNAVFSGTPSGTTGPASYTVTATATSGHVFGEGEATQVFTGTLSGPQTEGCTTEPRLVVPSLLTPKDLCGTEDDHYGLPANTADVTYSRDGRDILATLTGDDTAWSVVGQGGWTFDSDTVIRFAFPTRGGPFTNEPCTPGVEVIPVPTQFAAQPAPPTCDADGTLQDFGLFPNVTWQINPEFDGPGEYVLTVFPKEGFAFDPDNLPAGWGYEPEGGAISRVLTVLPRTGTQSTNPNAPCFQGTTPPPTLTPGTISAVCVSDVPYLSYAVTPSEGVTGPVTITFVNPAGTGNVVYTNQPLSGQVLWPGAQVTPTKTWPGWSLDGLTQTTDPARGGWARPSVQVIFEVNPTYTTTVTYPPASSICANPPARAGVTPVSNTLAARPSAATLAATGSSPLLPLGAAGILALVGTGLVLARKFAAR